ncbi:MAG: hypothetical protein JNK04_11725, partial [Myxococcales bacterium]|nr:hypothetical protein [Myxococcales bacterium]
MSRRELCALTLLAISCNGDACKSATTRSSEVTAVPEPPVTSAPVTFDDVPRLVQDASQITLPPIFPAIAKLPASVRSVGRLSSTESITPQPGILRAAGIAEDFCEAPSVSGLPLFMSRLYVPEALADALADPQLPAWLECGAKAAISSRHQYYVVAIADGTGERALYLLPPDARAAPRFYQTPGTTPAGLEQLSCDQLDGEKCAAHAHAFALVPRLAVVATGDFSALSQLATESGGTWSAAAPGRIPSFSPDEVAAADIELRGHDWSDLGLLGDVFSLDYEEGLEAAKELERALD